MIFERQISFWGEEKQHLLKEASVFVAGLGGLGCLLSEILVRSGVGKVYIFDRDTVRETDLNRQFFYTQYDLGKRKIDVASDWLSRIHAYTDIIPMYGDILEGDFFLPGDINGVADCLDNFESRFALWKSLEKGLFYVHSGVEAFFGQVLSLIKGRSSDLSEIFANYDDSERIIPVSANSASVVSSLASTEVIYNLFNEPKLLNTILVIDLSDYSFNKIRL